MFIVQGVVAYDVLLSGLERYDIVEDSSGQWSAWRLG